MRAAQSTIEDFLFDNITVSTAGEALQGRDHEDGETGGHDKEVSLFATAGIVFWLFGGSITASEKRPKIDLSFATT
jgi:hypothetical protein